MTHITLVCFALAYGTLCLTPVADKFQVHCAPVNTVPLVPVCDIAVSSYVIWITK